MDKYYEQFITKDYGNLPNLLNMISKTILLLGIVFLSINIFIGAIFIIASIVIEIVMLKKSVEYEYEYIDGEMTLSKIIGKRKRKTLGKITLVSLSKVCMKSSIDKSQKLVVCTIDGLGLKEIVIINNDKTCYLVGLDEKMYQILKRANPSLFAYI